MTETREGREEKKKSRSDSRTHCRSVLNQLSGSLAVPCDGTGHLWWTARCSSASWRTAVAPPVEGSRQRVPRSLLLPKHGGWQQASASRRTGRLLRSLSDGSHPSSTQEHGSESSVPPVLLLLQHHRFGQPLAQNTEISSNSGLTGSCWFMTNLHKPGIVCLHYYENAKLEQRPSPEVKKNFL